MKKSSLLIFTIILVLTTIGVGQTVKDTTGYTFTDIKEVKYTSVKNQHRSGTCWSFSGLAFLEAELLRTKNKEYDFSEMFIVRHSYSDKATKYVRFQGTLNFAGGGSFYDVIETIRKQGIVPEQAYPGLSYSEDMHVHGE
jgi:bleomycin hydrolase